MRFGPLARLANVPAYRSLVLAAILVGFRDAMAEPYMVLYLVEKAGLQPLAVGIFLTARAVGAVLWSMALGLWFDRAPSTRPVILALLTGVAGFALCAVTTSFPLLVLIAAFPLGASSAAFSQLFALAKGHLDKHDETTAERGISVMRASFSAAWAIGPMLGALVVGLADFEGVFLANALCGLLAYGTLLWSGVRASGCRPSAEDPEPEARTGTKVGLSAAAFTCFFMALNMGWIALPIVLTRDLHGSNGDVGLAASLCAFLEVPVMIAVALRPALLGGYGGLAGGFVAMMVYFAALALAPSIGLIVASQTLRAVAIGLVTCVGISYVQELMPNRAGAAAALFTITGQIGALLSGLAAGEWATMFGYRSMFLVCIVECAIGLVLLTLGARPLRVAEATA